MVENFRTVEADVLVVGAGAAGGRAAIEANRNGASVIIVDKGVMGKFGVTATAGMRATPSKRTFNYKECLDLGCYLNDQELLWKVTSEAPADHQEMAGWATRNIDSLADALHNEILRRPGIRLMDYIMVTKLLTRDEKVVGAAGLDMRNCEFVVFKSKAVILATGGVGELYKPSECLPLDMRSGGTGDTNALAYHAGVEQVNIEMTQFQILPGAPKWMMWTRHVLQGTALGFWTMAHDGPFYDKDGKELVGEDFIRSIWPEGADIDKGVERRADYHGEYNPKLERRIYREMMNGPVYIDYGKKLKAKYGDLSAFISKEKERAMTTTSTIVDRELSSQYPYLTDPDKYLGKVRIVIGVLLGQGGPKINLKGETNLPGMYGAGEGGGSGCLYGAFRPGGSMDTCLTMGRIAGENAAQYVKTVKQGDADIEEVQKERDRIFRFLEPKPEPADALEVKNKIYNITGKYLFMFRTEKGLKEAIKRIDEVRLKDLPRIQCVDTKRMNWEWVEALEVPFMLDTAEMIARSALFRTESRGCQQREDYPKLDNENWLCHTLLKKGKDGKMELSKGKVVMTKFKPPSEEECLKGGEPIPI